MDGVRRTIKSQLAGKQRKPNQQKLGCRKVYCLLDTYQNGGKFSRLRLHLECLGSACSTLEVQSPGLKVLHLVTFSGELYTSETPSKSATELKESVILPTTDIVFLYRKYRVVVALDLSPSVFQVSQISRLRSFGKGNVKNTVHAIPFEKYPEIVSSLFRGMLNQVGVMD